MVDVDQDAQAADNSRRPHQPRKTALSLADAKRRQTLASFDYQWGEMPEGDAMLSDPWFVQNVARIVQEELLALDRGWFVGRTVLDAGCGGGRWTCGLLQLGCRVLAVDQSERALGTTRAQVERLVPQALAEGRFETLRVDLLEPPSELLARRFDLVFSFGVLHHTGDTRRALGTIAPLVAEDGWLFLYLYGSASVGLLNRAVLAALRVGLSPLSFESKRRALALLFPGRDTHQAFDLFSPLVNDRYDRATLAAWLRALGFTDVVHTLDHTENYVRASRGRSGGAGPLATRPYWFERYQPRR